MKTEIVITDINIPFLDLVGIMIKVAIASVPAVIVVSLFWGLLGGLFIGIIKGLH